MKSFHYAWLLLSIVLVVWKLQDDSKFPLLEEELPEAVQFASLWSTKDAMRIAKTKIFWVLIEMDLRMAINHHSRLSPTLVMQLLAYVAFKDDFHRVYIQARNDPDQKWHDLPYLVIETDVQEVVVKWLAEWRTRSELATRPNMVAGSSAAHKRKEAAKQDVRTLATWKNKEAAKKAPVEQERAAKE